MTETYSHVKLRHTYMNIIIRILANSLAIIIAARFIPGFIFEGSLISLFIAGAIIAFFNGFIRPIVQLISLPITILTLGLFYVIINIAILILAMSFVPSVIINGFWSAFWGVVIISLTNGLISSLIKKNARNN